MREVTVQMNSVYEASLRLMYIYTKLYDCPVKMPKGR